MRYVLGILCVLFFIGFGACTLMLGGPTSEVYELRNVLFIGALACAGLSAILLILLAFGAGARGKARSAWRVPVLCALLFILSVGTAIAIFFAMPEGRTPQGEELNVRLGFGAILLAGFALLAFAGLITAIISTKKHNAKLLNQWHPVSGNPSFNTWQ
jgi:hypothetical protein